MMETYTVHEGFLQELTFIRLDLLGTASIYIHFLQLEFDKRDKNWAYFVEKQALRFFILFWHQAPWCIRFSS